MAEPTGEPVRQQVIFGLSLDEASTREAAEKLKAAQKDLQDKLNQQEKAALDRAMKQVTEAVTSREDKTREHYRRLINMNEDLFKSEQINAERYYSNLKALQDKQMQELGQLRREQQAQMSEFARGVAQGVGVVTGVATTFTILGFLQQIAQAISATQTYTRQALQLTSIMGGGPGIMGGFSAAGEEMRRIALQFPGMEQQQVFQGAAGIAATRQAPSGRVLGLTEESMRLAGGTGLSPGAGPALYSQLLQAGVPIENLKSEFLDMARVAKDLRIPFEMHIKNVTQLNEILKPFGFTMKDAQAAAATWGDELRRGIVSVQAIGQYMTGVANAPLGTLGFMGAQMAQSPEMMQRLSPAAREALQGASSPFAMASVMRGIAQGRFGADGDPRVVADLVRNFARTMAMEQTQGMGGPGATQAATAEFARQLMVGMGMQVGGLRQEDILKILDNPQGMKDVKTTQEQMLEQSMEMTRELEKHKDIFVVIKEILQQAFQIMVAGFSALVAWLSGAPDKQRATDRFNAQVRGMAALMGEHEETGWTPAPANIAEMQARGGLHTPGLGIKFTEEQRKENLARLAAARSDAERAANMGLIGIKVSGEAVIMDKRGNQVGTAKFNKASVDTGLAEGVGRGPLGGAAVPTN